MHYWLSPEKLQSKTSLRTSHCWVSNRFDFSKQLHCHKEIPGEAKVRTVLFLVLVNAMGRLILNELWWEHLPSTREEDPRKDVWDFWENCVRSDKTHDFQLCHWSTWKLFSPRKLSLVFLMSLTRLYSLSEHHYLVWGSERKAYLKPA